jgi:hypothetical protein
MAPSTRESADSIIARISEASDEELDELVEDDRVTVAEAAQTEIERRDAEPEEEEPEEAPPGSPQAPTAAAVAPPLPERVAADEAAARAEAAVNEAESLEKAAQAAEKGDALEPGEGEPLHFRAGTWVKLGNTEDVPEWAHGRLAEVTTPPKTVVCQDPECEVSPRPHEHQDPDGEFLVRTRDDKGVEFPVTRDDIVAFSNAGRTIEVDN